PFTDRRKCQPAESAYVIRVVIMAVKERRKEILQKKSIRAMKVNAIKTCFNGSFYDVFRLK
ncbi:hypothetical protein LZC02_10055, partial [Campylobacter jejuni]|nr:hypothetical protein [Campylobacter jejuni]